MRRFNIMSWVTAFGLLLGATACNDDDEIIKTPLNEPLPVLTVSTESALSFQWEKVNDAIQYAYELKEKRSGEIVGADVIAGNSIDFSGLKLNTEYIFSVWAYAELLSDHSTSKTSILEVSTLAAIPFTVDDLCDGTKWNIRTTGFQYVSSSSDEEFDITRSYVITKVDDNTISIRGIYWSNSNRALTAIVDVENRTLTFEPQTWNTYYTFANIEDVNLPVVGRIEWDLTIVIENWTAWYNGWTYFEDAKVIMTRSN